MELKQLFAEGLVWSTEQPLSPAAISYSSAIATFGIEEIDRELPFGGLPFGSIHQCALEDSLATKTPYCWHAPLFIVSALLGNTVSTLSAATKIPPHKKLIAWVGRRCWPTAHVLQNVLNQVSGQNFSEEDSNRNWDENWIRNCLFINPPNKAKRIWTIIQLLRSPVTLAVIADGSSLQINTTRQLQLAAKKGNSLGLIISPPWELEAPTAAQTKWKFSSLPSEEETLRWSVELLRAKGAAMPVAANVNSGKTRGLMNQQKKWLIEWEQESNNGKGSFRIVIEERREEARDSSERRMA